METKEPEETKEEHQANILDRLLAFFRKENSFNITLSNGIILGIILFVFVVFCSICVREYLWQAQASRDLNRINELEVIILDAQKRLEIDDKIMENLLILHSCNVTLNNSSSILQDPKYTILSPPAILFDRMGWIQSIVMMCIIAFEVYYLHEPLLSDLEKEPDTVSKQCYSSCKLYLSRFLPFCHGLLSLVVLFFGTLAWLGILNRSKYCFQVSKGILLWSWCIPWSFLLQNIHRIYPYLPKNRENFFQSVGDLHWWLWLFKGLFAFDDIFNFLHCYLGTIVVWLAVWPIRYFFFYESDSFLLSSSDLATAFYVFQINNLAHLAVTLFVWAYVALDLFRSPIFIDSFLRHWFAKQFSSSNATLLLLLGLLAVALLSILLLIFRLFWFGLATRVCKTYYCVFVSCIVPVVAHICLIFAALPLLVILIQRYGVYSKHQDTFLKMFLQGVEEEKNVKLSQSSADSSSEQASIETNEEVKPTSIEDDETEGRELLTQLLRCASILLVFDESMKKTVVEIKQQTDRNEPANRSEEANSEPKEELAIALELVILSVAKSGESSQQPQESDTSKESTSEPSPPPSENVSNPDDSCSCPLEELN